MIDTDKYEGHTEGPWAIATWRDGRAVYDIVRNDDNGESLIANVVGYWGARKPNMNLIADAPHLLAEVKRLRSVMIYVEQRHPHFALEWALKEGLTLTEIKERIE